MRLSASERRPAGFTLIELLVVITIIGILAAIALPNYIKAKDKAKEVQVKSAIKAIQVAVERYHTDFEEYPLFLIGGDLEGWRVWHRRYDEPNPDMNQTQNAWVKDPLISYNYLDSYPNNPFVDSGTAVIQQTGLPTGPGGSHQAGDGDPRFGFRGNTMGNGMEYPMVFRRWIATDTAQNIATERTLRAVTNNNVAVKGFGVPENGSGLHFVMGGRRAVKTENGQQVVYTAFTHWPGNFFYRGFPERPIARKGWTIYFPHVFVKSQTSRYILGGYGSYTTEGIDVARLEERDNSGSQIYYRYAPPWGADENIFQARYEGGISRGGLPEVAGGGGPTAGPYNPPDTNPEHPNSFIYGAPDGHKDAVILVLTAGEEVQAFY
ncbi:MAG: hypothetical protein GEEBNDBF_01194 [bacterium]|nr:hypothetical protein [bacterium]